MSKRLSRLDLARQRAQDVFTGRQQPLDSFERDLRLPLDNPNRKFIWAVSGIGGIGKTTLLRRFQAIAEGANHLTAWVDEFTPPSVLSVMQTIASRLERQGHALKAFSDEYEKLRRRLGDSESGMERPVTWGHTGGRVAVELLRQVPIAGGVAVGLMGGDEAVAAKGGELACIVVRKLGSGQTVVSQAPEPIEALTPIFVESLSRLARISRSFCSSIPTSKQNPTSMNGHVRFWRASMVI